METYTLELIPTLVEMMGEELMWLRWPRLSERGESSSNVREGFEIVVLDDKYALAVETNILVTNLNLFLSE